MARNGPLSCSWLLDVEKHCVSASLDGQRLPVVICMCVHHMGGFGAHDLIRPPLEEGTTGVSQGQESLRAAQAVQRLGQSGLCTSKPLLARDYRLLGAFEPPKVPTYQGDIYLSSVVA